LGPESNYAVKRIMHLSDMHLSGVYCTFTFIFDQKDMLIAA